MILSGLVIWGIPNILCICAVMLAVTSLSVCLSWFCRFSFIPGVVYDYQKQSNKKPVRHIRRPKYLCSKHKIQYNTKQKMTLEVYLGAQRIMSSTLRIISAASDADNNT